MTISFPVLGKFSSIISSIFSWSLFLSSSSGTPMIWMLGCLTLSQRSLRLSWFLLFFFIFYFFNFKSLILTCVPKHEPPSHLPPIINESERKQEKLIKRNEDNLRDLQDNMKRSNSKYKSPRRRRWKERPWENTWGDNSWKRP